MHTLIVSPGVIKVVFAFEGAIPSTVKEIPYTENNRKSAFQEAVELVSVLNGGLPVAAKNAIMQIGSVAQALQRTIEAQEKAARHE